MIIQLKQETEKLNITYRKTACYQKLFMHNTVITLQNYNRKEKS
ncbi:Uncharacterized protein dnl_63260 [Desulfonema limicola]|uniref:Uncharacterized protein n=1 Tax=Desulfonema limicola TaxID=45656 RepID=A0A975BE82_9BACT|nr:Uncharacterized protein dnl_63260 [Desulfonema limicola]